MNRVPNSKQNIGEVEGKDEEITQMQHDEHQKER